LVVSNGVVALGVAVYFLQEVFGFGGGEVAVEWLELCFGWASVLVVNM